MLNAQPVPREADVMLEALQADNDAHLEQLAELVGRVPTKDFAEPNGPDDAIGSHVRHVLEHYESLLNAVDDTIDYEGRSRDPDVSARPPAALEGIEGVRGALGRFVERVDVAGGDRPLTVTRTHGDHAGPQTSRMRSSVGRELMFLLSHTVHHMALIAILARQRGVEVPADFGVAPSTLRHYGR